MKYLILLIIFNILFLSCQQRGEKQQALPPQASECEDKNNNEICDKVDTDNDGLLDEGEAAMGTDPKKSDTDGDGASDLCEVQNGSDPLDKDNISASCQNQTYIPDDQGFKTACTLFESQKKQNEWLNNNYLAQKKCEKIPAEDGEGKPIEETLCSLNFQSGNEVFAQNYGDPDAAVKKEMEIEIEWGVSFKDVIIIQNGVISIRPWFVYYQSLFDSWAYDDLMYDHHLGNLPSTALDCKDAKGEINNDFAGIARIKIAGVEHVWFQPAFLPFKIPGYSEKQYPLSIDAVKLISEKEEDGIQLIGSSQNGGFTFLTHLISVENKDAGYKSKRNNRTCLIRKVTFKLEYYESIEQSSEFLYNYSELEKECQEFSR